ncbi:MAG: hypothetical protein JWL77_5263 [Chthonomonadaceae bacterium]|nr:hypothetical protein [Chthonomonadaceae bacterium]
MSPKVDSPLVMFLMESYRERKKREHIRFLKLTQDADRLIVRPPRYWVGFGLGLLVAVLIFLAGVLLPFPFSKVESHAGWLPAPQEQALLFDGRIVSVPPRQIDRPETRKKPEWYFALVGLTTVASGFLTGYVGARVFRGRIVLDRRNDELREGKRMVGSLTTIDHVGWAKYKTLASRALVTHYEVALFFRDGARKPLLIWEVNSSDPYGLAQAFADFLRVPVREYDHSIT